MPRTCSVRSGALCISARASPMSHSPDVAYFGPVICIGASTGGTEAVKTVLQNLVAGMPPILIVQHMPESFTAAFARRLDSVGPVRVKEAGDGESLRRGWAYIAPGHSHLAIRRTPAGYRCQLLHDAPVNRHRPSVDRLFQSVAGQVGAGAVGVLLTGMGKDGAAGLLELRRCGAWTIAQDQASSVVYGMPREAAAIGAAVEILPLDSVAGHLCRRLGIHLSDRAC